MANQKGELPEQIWLESQPELADCAFVPAFLAKGRRRGSECARCKEKQTFQCRPNHPMKETRTHPVTHQRPGSRVQSARFSLIICGFFSLLALSDWPGCAPTSVALQSS